MKWTWAGRIGLRAGRRQQLPDRAVGRDRIGLGLHGPEPVAALVVGVQVPAAARLRRGLRTGRRRSRPRRPARSRAARRGPARPSIERTRAAHVARHAGRAVGEVVAVLEGGRALDEERPEDRRLGGAGGVAVVDADRRASTGPRMSEARTNSWRLSSVMWPVRVRKSIAANHSSSVSSTSLAKACRWRASACMSSRRRGIGRAVEAGLDGPGQVGVGEVAPLGRCRLVGHSSTLARGARPVKCCLTPRVAGISRLGPMDLKLEDKVAVVTGASKGIGLAIVSASSPPRVRSWSAARAPSTHSRGSSA